MVLCIAFLATIVLPVIIPIQVYASSAPSAIKYLPFNNGTNEYTDTTMMLYFDKPVTAVAGKYITIKKASDDSTFESIEATDAKITVNNSNFSVTINPAGTLSRNTKYYINIEAGAFVDQATGLNSYAGISDKTTWAFTTIPNADSIHLENASNNSISNMSEQTWNHNIQNSSGTNRMVIFQCASKNSSDTPVLATSVKFNGVNMTKLTQRSMSGGGYSVTSELWYIMDKDLPASLGSYPVTVTFSGSCSAISGTVSFMVLSRNSPKLRQVILLHQIQSLQI